MNGLNMEGIEQANSNAPTTTLFTHDWFDAQIAAVQAACVEYHAQWQQASGALNLLMQQRALLDKPATPPKE